MRLDELTSNTWSLIPERVEKKKQGIHLWYKGCPYPVRVYYSFAKDPNFHLRTLNALGTIKKALYLFLHLKDLVIPRTFKISRYDKILNELRSFCNWHLGEFFIEDDEYSVPVWEIGQAIERFLSTLGFRTEDASFFRRVLMMLLEFDNAYRYRVQDILGEANKQALLDNPSKELHRLMNIYLEREEDRKDEADAGARGKILRLFKVIQLLLWLPKPRKAFRAAIEKANFKKMSFDKNDRFHISFWLRYDFEGKTWTERYEPNAEIFKKLPYRKKEDPKVTMDFLTGN